MDRKRDFERLAHPAKRHYTFARRRRHEPGRPAANTAHQAHNALIFRLFCSLRLSVRTPPFHGGESGSIPLGSAIIREPRQGAQPPCRHLQAPDDHVAGLTQPLSWLRFPSAATSDQRTAARNKRWDREMDTAVVTITSCVALYLALRLTMRFYFPPDT